MAQLKTHLLKALTRRKTAQDAHLQHIRARYARSATAAQTAAAAAAAAKIPPQAASQPSNGGTP